MGTRPGEATLATTVGARVPGAAARRRVVRRPVRAAVKLTFVELKLVLREPLTLVFSFAFPVVLLFVMGEVFGQQTGEPGEVVFRDFGAMNYYVPGYLALVSAAYGMITLPTHLASYRERGVLRRFHASGVRGWQVLGSQTLVGLALATVGALLVAILGMVFYDVRDPGSIGGVVLAYFLSTVCFMVLGSLLGAIVPRARAAQGIGLILFFVMMFVSGTAPPIEVMSGPMVAVGKALPLYHGAFALQDAWNGLGINVTELGILAAVAVGGLGLTSWLFRWD